MSTDNECPRWSDLFGIDPAFPAADPLAEAWDSGYHVGLDHGRGGARLVHESGETVDCNPFRQTRTETGTGLAAVIAQAKCEDCAPDLADERADILARFTAELAKATGDGSKKRQAGTKPPWYQDDSHEAAMYRHLERWEAGEKHDPDHEAHPLVAAAWRAIAIACKESGNVPNG